MALDLTDVELSLLVEYLRCDSGLSPDLRLVADKLELTVRTHSTGRSIWSSLLSVRLDINMLSNSD